MAGLMKRPETGGKPKRITTKGKPGDTGPWGANPARNKVKQETMGETNVSPEEQAQYDEFVSNGLNLIYDEKGLDSIMTTLAGDGNPVEGLANTLVSVVGRLEGSAKESGTPISGDVILHGSGEILEGLVEMSEKAGLHDFSEEDMESAFFMAADQYRNLKQEAGELPEEQLKADFQSILQAEGAGTLNDVLPGVEEYAQRAPQPE